MIQVVHPGPGSWFFYSSRSRGQKATGRYLIRLRNTMTYHPIRSALGVSSSSRWLVGWFPSIFTSKQTRPLSAPCVARTPAHMYPNPSLEIAFTLQKSAVPIFKLRSESSKKEDHVSRKDQCCWTGTGFGFGSIRKWNKKVNTSKMRSQPPFVGNSAASNIEKARFCTNFLLSKNCARRVRK